MRVTILKARSPMAATIPLEIHLGRSSVTLDLTTAIIIHLRLHLQALVALTVHPQAAHLHPAAVGEAEVQVVGVVA